MHPTSLASLEVLLGEFYGCHSSNSRKREIEAELQAFKGQPEAWQLCLRVATDNAIFEKNPFLWFFSTSTLEHTITRRWSHLSPGDRSGLREALWNSYAQLGLSWTGGNRNTLATLIAQMGKREFPDEDPNYVKHCLELTRTRFPLGINLLRITSEEVVSNRGDLNTERKQYFISCISMCVPDIMDVITKSLLIAVCQVNCKDIHTSIPNTFMDYSLISALPKDDQLAASILELLGCAQHFVSWVRPEVFTEYFLLSILDLSQWRAEHEVIAMTSLSVMNELFYLQKALPFPGLLMTGVGALLEQHNSSKTVSDMYSDKFRELLRLYTIKYASKLVEEPDMMEAFIKSLYLFTIERHGALDFTEKLDVWTPIIKEISNQGSTKTQRYHNVLLQLGAEIMRRAQFQYNKAELEQLDHDSEDGCPSEWQQFLDQCFETMALLASIRGPSIVFAETFSHWARPHHYLLNVDHTIRHEQRSDEIAKKLKNPTFSEHLKDYSTVCQAVVRVTHLMPLDSEESSDVNHAEMDCQLQMLTDSLLQALQLLADNKFVRMDVGRANYLTDLDNLYAQVLMAIRSVFPLSKSLHSDELLHRLFALLGTIFLSSNSLATVSCIVQQAASDLLLFISAVMRPKCLFEIPEIRNLMQAGSRLNTQLPRDVSINIQIGLVSYLVLPWKNVPDQQQDYQSRQWMLREYIDGLSASFMELNLAASDIGKVTPPTVCLLGTLTALIKFFKASNSNAKDMLATAFKPILARALEIFNTFGLSNTAMPIAVADFSLGMLRTLPSHLGADFIKEMVTLFINVSSRETITLNRYAVLEKVLQMFKLIAEQHGSASLNLLPSILDFSTQQVLPLVQQQNSATEKTDLTSLLYDLFHSVLAFKWQFFYKNHVANGFCSPGSNGVNPAYNYTENLQPERFMAILNAYGQMLVTGTDPSNVRSVLQSMQNIHERNRLYRKNLFREQLLASFQRALINLLTTGEGALHFELIAQALFDMGQVDRQLLHDNLMNAALPVPQEAIDSICRTNDIPTFTQKLSNLMQDAQYAHLLA